MVRRGKFFYQILVSGISFDIIKIREGVAHWSEAFRFTISSSVVVAIPWGFGSRGKCRISPRRTRYLPVVRTGIVLKQKPGDCVTHYHVRYVGTLATLGTENTPREPRCFPGSPGFIELT